MRIEYSAPRNLHRNTWQENSELLWKDNQKNNWVPTDVVSDSEDRLYLAGAYIRHGNIPEAYHVMRQVESNPSLRIRVMVLDDLIEALAIDTDWQRFEKEQTDRLTWGKKKPGTQQVDLESKLKMLNDIRLAMSIIEGIQYWTCWAWPYDDPNPETRMSQFSQRYLGHMEEALAFIMSRDSVRSTDKRIKVRAETLYKTVQAERRYRENAKGLSPLCPLFDLN